MASRPKRRGRPFHIPRLALAAEAATGARAAPPPRCLIYGLMYRQCHHSTAGDVGDAGRQTGRWIPSGAHAHARTAAKLKNERGASSLTYVLATSQPDSLGREGAAADVLVPRPLPCWLMPSVLPGCTPADERNTLTCCPLIPPRHALCSITTIGHHTNKQTATKPARDPTFVVQAPTSAL